MYCNRQSDNGGLDRAYTIGKGKASWNRNAPGYRLPTEAEWEYACRTGRRPGFDAGYSITKRNAHFLDLISSTVPAESFPSNDWGLYCMPGNVFERCWDFYAPYTREAQVNPAGPANGAERVTRGGRS